jgi:hypothetical protein
MESEIKKITSNQSGEAIESGKKTEKEVIDEEFDISRGKKKESAEEIKSRLQKELEALQKDHDRIFQGNEGASQELKNAGIKFDSLGESAREEKMLEKSIKDIQLQLGALENNNEEKVEAGDIKESNLSVEGIVEEIKKMPEDERSKIEIGAHNIGFAMEKVKAKIFSGLTGFASEFAPEGGTANKFLKALSGTYKNDSDLQERKMANAESEEGKKLLKTSNRLKVASNILKVASYIGHGPAMSVASVFSRGVETAKKMRLGSEEVLEKTRINDEDAAAEEAWGIYNQAKESSKGDPSKIDLQRAYEKNIPKDVLERLSKSKGENVAQSFLMKMMQKPMEFSAKRLDKKIQAVENNKKLTPEQKEAKKNNLLDTYSRALNDLDGIVSKTGEVDTIAAGCKYAEIGGKVVMGAIMAKTVYDTMEKIWDKMADIFSDSNIGEISDTISKVDVTKGMSEKHLQDFHKYQEWAKEMHAEKVFSDRALAAMPSIVRDYEYKSFEDFERMAKSKLLGEFVREHGMAESWTDKQGLMHIKTEFKGMTVEEIFNKDGQMVDSDTDLKDGEYGLNVHWDPRDKSWHEVKDNIIDPNSKSAKDLEDLGAIESKSHSSGLNEDIKMPSDFSKSNLETTIFEPGGKEQFMEAMKKLAGQHAEEAYKQNIGLIKTEIDAYQKGDISKEELQKWSEGFNNKLKEIGAKSDIIEIEKILRLKLKNIQSSNIDSNAF